ncbi:MAG: helix-turn-helix domain-containing protein [Candidatus Marinimicrobia bacterium]|nr:helix-turn-helix domain-containing protein [Candidatus Neomarinimicrobiota bacterium]MBT4362159.1 helix-turn-helix domain-containing protein [Candidatus Neomarinimicrobiota bacterium]MBT4713780.1 helix-turn-helix domain-containing protein [Candidatus Neomarinimicrobiota bacterium]MBT4945490.1 helix-turn-helix domain-containing protein [Candidatus Neomarinimicrobiota bacterium]MBT6010339.1 helix-turn-helix domain-containing protein [Candidatus Neomarinimicrobiota bacterium]
MYSSHRLFKWNSHIRNSTAYSDGDTVVVNSFYNLYSKLRLLLLIVYTPLAISAQTAQPTHYLVHKQWGVAEGLPTNSVTALAQTSDGYLWLGTPEGLIRFDGFRFEHFGPWNILALSDSHVSALWVDADGTLWVGLDSGAGARLEMDGSWHHLSGNQAAIRYFTRDKHDSVLVGTDIGFAKIISDTIRFDLTGTDTTLGSVTGVATLRSGDLVGAFSKRGLVKQSELKWNPFKSVSTIPTPVSAVLELNTGELAIGTPRGLQIMDDTGGSPFLVSLESERRYSPIITRLVQDTQNNLWIGTLSSGLYCWIPDTDQAIQVRHVPIKMVQSMLVDQDGAIWIGSDQAGLLRLEQTGLFTLDERAGLPDLHVRAVSVDATGQLWAGTNSGDLLRFKDDQVIESLHLDGPVLALFAPESDMQLAGTDQMLYLLNQKRDEWRVVAKKVLRNPVVSFSSHKNRSIILATETQLFVAELEPDALFLHELSDQAPAPIRMIKTLPDGNILIATGNGLYKLIDRHFFRLRLSEKDEDVDILFIHYDEEIGIWLGTAGQGMMIWKAGEEYPHWLGSRSGLVDPFVFSIYEQAGGQIWLSGYRGISSTSDSLIHNNTTRQSTIWRNYSQSSGMRTLQCISSGGGALAIGKQDEIYYPTLRGIVRIDPEVLMERELEPIPILNKLLVGDESVEINNTSAQIFSSNQFIEFHFSAIAFRTPDKLQIRYRLQNFDDSWHLTESLTESKALYINLLPGRYTFQLQARFRGDEWSQAEVDHEFQIREPWSSRVNGIIITLLIASLVGWWLKVKKTPTKKEPKYSTSALRPETSDAVKVKLDRLITEEQVYLDANLTLQKLAQRLNIHYNYLSRILNEAYGKSYNDFINAHRIEAAKQLLTDPNATGRTILDILLSTGFFTKSVFNSAFKKATGMTPTEYRKRHS